MIAVSDEEFVFDEGFSVNGFRFKEAGNEPGNGTGDHEGDEQDISAGHFGDKEHAGEGGRA